MRHFLSNQDSKLATPLWHEIIVPGEATLSVDANAMSLSREAK
jgi:hypothetical protein